jgi:tetratricopeptide (TPR) repeat protein
VAVWLLLALGAIAAGAPPALAQAAPPAGAGRGPVSLIAGAHRQPNPTAEAELGRSRQLLAGGQSAEALAAARRAAQLDSLSALVFERLGVVCQAVGQPRAAYQAFRRASLLDPASAWALNRAAQVLLADLGRPAGALAALRQAQAVEPHFAPAHYTLSVYHLLRGEIADAEREADLALEQAAGTDDEPVFFGVRTQMLMLRGQYREAEDGLRRHLFESSEDLRARQARALALRLLGRYQEAKEELLRLAEQVQPQAVLLNDLGSVHLALGDPDSAAACFAQAWDLDSTASEAGYHLARARLAAADTSGALGWLARVEGRDRGWYTTALLAAGIHAARGDSARAGRAFARARALNPLSFEGPPAVGGALWRARQPGPRDSLVVRAEQALVAGEFGAALQLGYQACLDDQVRPQALLCVYWANRPSGLMPGGAVAQLEAVLEGLPAGAKTERAVAERELGLRHLRLGNAADARAHLEKALEILPPSHAVSAPAAAALIGFYSDTGDATAANRMAVRVADTADAELLAALARAARAAGQTERARTLEERAAAAEFLPSEPR